MDLSHYRALFQVRELLYFTQPYAPSTADGEADPWIWRRWASLTWQPRVDRTWCSCRAGAALTGFHGFGDGLYLWFICWIMFLCFIFWRGKPFHFVEGKIFSFYFWWMMYFLIKTKHIWRCLNIFDDDNDNDDVTVMGLRDTFIWNLALLRQTRQRHLTCETKQLLASGDIFRAGWTCLQGEFVIIRNHKSQQLILDPHGFALTAYDHWEL